VCRCELRASACLEARGCAAGGRIAGITYTHITFQSCRLLAHCVILLRRATFLRGVFMSIFPRRAHRKRGFGNAQAITRCNEPGPTSMWVRIFARNRAEEPVVAADRGRLTDCAMMSECH